MSSVTKFVLLISLVIFSADAMPRASVPETYINHAWVSGVYWNPDALPGWGFFVNVQEETIFGAVYGYEGAQSTFITFQGEISTANPLVFRGDVFFVTNGGSTVTDVGNFTWTNDDFEASPAATLTITSNILSRTNLRLFRFSYAEIDKVDMFTAGDWNIVRRVLGISFADHYGIFDDRFVEDGTTFAGLINNSDPDKVGVVGYYSDKNGYFYSMLVQFSEDSYVFYVFVASDTNMYGRYWLLDEGETPTGTGNYFHGSADTMQMSHQTLPGESISARAIEEQNRDSALNSTKRSNDMMRTLELEHNRSSGTALPSMFSESMVQSAFSRIRDLYVSRAESLRKD